MLQACSGLGSPFNFYLACVWLMAGLTAACVFLAGAMLSRRYVVCLFSCLKNQTCLRLASEFFYQIYYFILIHILISFILNKKISYSYVCLSPLCRTLGGVVAVVFFAYNHAEGAWLFV